MIEKLTGNSLHQQLRKHIFDPLDMNHTYLAYSTDPPAGPWQDRLSDHWGLNTALISTGVNLSMDWGAGGEVSTVQDLSTFTRALAAGALFQNQATLEEMFRLPEGIDRPFYAEGIIAWPTDDGLILHHNGAPGSWIEYHTAHNLSIVGTVNDMDRPERFMDLRADIYRTLDEVGLRSSNLRTGPASMSLLTTLMGALPLTPLVVLLGSVLTFLSALAAWFIALLRAQRSSEKTPPLASAARWLAAGTIALNLLFLVGIVLVIVRNPVRLMFGFGSAMLPIFLLPPLSIILTIGLIVLAVLTWKHGLWTVAGRIHYTLIMLATIAFLWTQRQLHLLMLP